MASKIVSRDKSVDCDCNISVDYDWSKFSELWMDQILGIMNGPDFRSVVYLILALAG